MAPWRIAACCVLWACTALGAGEAKPDVTVAADGTGDAASVQRAIDGLPAESPRRFVIRIKPGTYREKIRIPQRKPAITLIGDDAATTILSYDDCADTLDATGKKLGTFASASVSVASDDFEARNITIENTHGTGSQAVALRIGADRAVFKDCRIVGWQDTLLVERGRHYFESCSVSGHVDFIFGAATAVFARCEIHARAPGYITAASTPETQPFGLVFLKCVVTGDADLKGKKTFLGRPWRPYANVNFIECDLCGEINPLGWSVWNGNDNDKTARFGEYKNTGPGAAAPARAAWSKQLSETEAAQFTIKNILGGADKWDVSVKEEH